MPDTIVKTMKGFVKRVSHHRLDGTEIAHLWKVGSVTLMPRQLWMLAAIAVLWLVLGFSVLSAKSKIGGTRTGGGVPILCRLGLCR